MKLFFRQSYKKVKYETETTSFLAGKVWSLVTKDIKNALV